MYSLFFIIIFLFPFFGTCADSTQFQYKKLKAGVSGSLLSLSNWNGESRESFSFLLETDYYSSKSIGIRQKIFSGKTSLGYSQLIDSVRIKNSDVLNFRYFVKKQQQPISHSWSAMLNTQLLNSYSYEIVGTHQSLQRKWNGTFMNPGSLEVGYGMGIEFWKKSLVNISIASARFRVEPVTYNALKPNEGVFGKVNRGWLVFDYGLSGQLLVIKSFSQAWEWNSTGQFFLKSFEKKNVQMNVSNSVSYKFWKYMEMRADLKWVYEPLISFRMQYKNELLLGFVFNYDK